METSNEPSAETLAEPPKNVLPFRPIGETKPLALSPVENSAFNELARQLSARLDDNDNGATPLRRSCAEACMAEPAACRCASSR